MFIALMKMHTDPPRLHSVLDVLRSVAGPTLAQSGCESFDLWLDAQDSSTVMVAQRWSGREAIEAYMRSELFRRVMVALEQADREPEIVFVEAGTLHGMEWAEQVCAEPARACRATKAL